MNTKFEANDNTPQDQSGDEPNAPKVQGRGLQMNDNSAEGKKPAKSRAAPEAGEKSNSHDDQGKGLQVNENSAGA